MMRARATPLLSRPGLAVPPSEQTDAIMNPPDRNGLRGLITGHLGSHQVSRVIYGAIIGLALVVAIEAHPPAPGAVAATLIGTAVAVSLAELYSEVVGLETRERRKPSRAAVHHLRAESAAVAFGISFPAVFFVLAAARIVDDHTAFTLAKWTGVGLIAVYGFAGARLAGTRLLASLIQALAVALIGVFLILLKALVH
jgi:hypothetical protein